MHISNVLFSLSSSRRDEKNEVERSEARENEENFNLNKHHSAFFCEEWHICPRAPHTKLECREIERDGKKTRKTRLKNI